MTQTIKIEKRTAEQVFQEMNDTDHEKEPVKFCRLYNEWRELEKEARE